VAHLLDNIVWNTLTGPQANFASGAGGARRYKKGFSAIIGLERPDNPDFESLAPYCSKGEQFYCPDWRGAVPDGWRMEEETVMLRMIWAGEAPAHEPAVETQPLTSAHAAQALALAELTHPGPFGLRTIELGEYFGVFEGARLVAMAGERFHAGSFREISGVCTHPEYQRRGIARKLTEKVLLRELARGQQPFLHVMRDNVVARRLYERMGFRLYLETLVRVISVC
jgi:ribosomal protein S18 acetylase RimI-like enzyme